MFTPGDTFWRENPAAHKNFSSSFSDFSRSADQKTSRPLKTLSIGQKLFDQQNYSRPTKKILNRYNNSRPAKTFSTDKNISRPVQKILDRQKNSRPEQKILDRPKKKLDRWKNSSTDQKILDPREQISKDQYQFSNSVSEAKSCNFHFHKNDVTWPLSASGLWSVCWCWFFLDYVGLTDCIIESSFSALFLQALATPVIKVLRDPSQ